MNNVLIISEDYVSSNMGGVGVRYWELAGVLAKHCNVTLLVPNETDLTAENFRVISYDRQKSDLRPYIEDIHAIILHGYVLHFHPYLLDLQIPLGVDLYVPHLLETLVSHAHDDFSEWLPAYCEYLRVQTELLRAGDFFFCASERQRDYWLGWLHSVNRINPHTYQQDATLRKLIDVIPYGIPKDPPKQRYRVLKGIHPGIDIGDQLILWSGGLWDWLDPLTLIRAMAQLTYVHPKLKCYFMGKHHPNSIVNENMTMPQQAISLAEELGVLNRTVFFGDWVPYQERENYLVEADLTVMTHPNHIETRFAFRTRLLDSIWARLPIVVTEGDAISEWVERDNLGLTVPAGDIDAVAKAIEKILALGGKAAFASNFDRISDLLYWDKVAEPLVAFCLAPSRAVDKGHYITDIERISRDKDAFLEQVVLDKDAVIEDAYRQIERYRNSLPLQVYYRLKKIFRME